MDKRLKVLYVASEVEPFSKTGGLADVAGSLPKALRKKGVDIRIVTPRYKSVDTDMEYLCDFPVTIRNHTETCIIKETKIDNVLVYFVDNYYYYYRDGIYCHMDDGDRFAFFDKAILEMLPHIKFKPDIIHCNDWQSGPITLLLKEKYNDIKYYSQIETLFTIHNLRYQGNFDKNILQALDLDDEKYFNTEYTEFYGSVGFMKIGLQFADYINAVSPNYANEIQTEEYGENLDGLLKARKDKLCGILNGIDTSIYKGFNSKDIFDEKEKSKIKLQKILGFPVNKDIPMFSLISRLTDQKGLDILSEQLEGLLKKDVQVVILGIGDPYYEKFFKKMEKTYKDKMRACIEFNSSLAIDIYAGSDIFLMPSKFEPCGLGQMMALRYGTIPIVRATGGLKDSVKDIVDDGIGFCFEQYSVKELSNAIDRALDLYKSKDKWKEVVSRAINTDFSWNFSAEKYLELYSNMTEAIVDENKI